MTKFILIITCICFHFVSYGQYDLRTFGYVTNKETGEPLVGVKVEAPNWNAETYTNNFGYYSLSVPSQDVVLTYSIDQFFNLSDTFYLDADTMINIALKPYEINEDVIQTPTNSKSLLTSAQSGKIDISTNLLKEIPYLFSERDIIKGLQSLPGIVPGNEFGSNLYIRGGAADQNLVLLDGIPVYNGNHIFGLLSIFQPEIMNSIQVFKSGFSSKYGGRVSSVVDITMNEGSNNSYGEMSITPLMGRVSVNGPLGRKNKSTFSVAGRRSFWDLFGVNTDQNQPGFRFNIYDFNFKTKTKIGKSDYLILSFFTGGDYFKLGLLDDTTQVFKKIELQYGNISGGIRYLHVFNPKLFVNVFLAGTRFKVEQKRTTIVPITGASSSQSNVNYLNGIGDGILHTDFEYNWQNTHLLKFGTHVNLHIINSGNESSIITGIPNVPDTKIQLGDKTWTKNPELAFYIEDENTFSKKLLFNYGVRLVYFSNKTFNYNGTFFEPRFNARYIINPTNSLKISYSRMNQFVSLITNAGTGLPYNFWVPHTSKVPAQNSNIINFGWATKLNQFYSLTIDAYTKTMNNILFARQDPSLYEGGEDWQKIVESGKGNSYGIEFLLQRSNAYFTGWMGYSLSYANRTFENLNLGKSFPYSYSRRHVINFVGNLRINEKNSIFFNYSIGSNRYFTLPYGKYLDIDQNLVLDYGELNNFKPKELYQRLDLGLLFERRTRVILNHQVFFTIYNIMLTKNPLNVFAIQELDNNGNYRFVAKKSFGARFMPGVSYIYKF